MECPIVKRTEYQLIDIDEEGYCSLMDDSGETRDDLKPIDPELEKEIRDKVENGEDALVCVLAVSILFFSFDKQDKSLTACIKLPKWRKVD